jgi:hypothetical protein
MITMNTTNSSHHQSDGAACSQTTHDEVARAAFSLYEKNGSQGGQDVRNWLDAEVHMKMKPASAAHGIQPATKASHQSARRPS